MGIQLFILASSPEIEAAIGTVASECDIFNISPHAYGVSIPGKVVDTSGDDWIRAKLSKLKHFDLWEGKWNSPKGERP